MKKGLVALFALIIIIFSGGCTFGEQENVFMNGNVSINIEVDDPFIDPGITTPEGYTIIKNGIVDTSSLGQYIINYTILDESGETIKELTRIINVIDNIKPSIALSENKKLFLGPDFDIKNLYTVSDNYYDAEDLIISDNYEEINPNNLPGVYSLTITAEDPSENLILQDVEFQIELDYYYIVENLDTISNGISEIEYDENTGPNQGDSYWIKFFNEATFNINSKGDFWIAMTYHQNDHFGVLFFSGNYEDLSSTKISLSIKNSLSLETSWLRLNEFDASFDYDELDLSESTFENPAVIDYNTALSIFNDRGLIAIEKVKAIYENIFCLSFNQDN
ncbi:MAG: DUF5011 domain-containing protein [Candidatus Izemoplasmatales bacterium]|nr:DUF5011 domain-containing protein [Candidatus Izemoplasmatales bacterium]